MALGSVLAALGGGWGDGGPCGHVHSCSPPRVLEAVCEVRVPGATPRRGKARSTDEDVAFDGGDAGLGACGPTLFEVDFGDSVLTCNAHNERCRAAWVVALRKWSAWRKKALDEDMLANFSSYAKKADVNSDDD